MLLNYLIAPLALLPFYLIGVYPTGYLLAKHYGVDLQHSGSGNVGTTNVTRILGARAGVATLAGDLLKGLISAGLATWIFSSPGWTSACACATVAGHCFSIPGKLKGGKGVATAFGTLLILEPLGALVCLLLFALCLLATRIVSVASLMAVFAAPLYSLFSSRPDSATLGLIVSAGIIFWRHRSNIQRLILGTEPKFSVKH